MLGFAAQNHPQQLALRGPLVDVDDRGTHPDVFDPLNARFGFTLDVAASPHNAKCERYFDVDLNGLAQPWTDEVVWCNPPFSDIRPWVEKAWEESRQARAIVMMSPANRTEQGWWQELVEPYRDRGGSVMRTEMLRGSTAVHPGGPRRYRTERAAALRVLPADLAGGPAMSPIRGSGDTLEAYRTTTIPIHESQADVRELLRARKATGMQITESWSGDQAFADVRFGMPGEAGGFYAYRIRVQVVVNDKDLERQPHRRTQTAREVAAQKERQIWRLVFWWLKAQFEAADAGLVSLEEAFLPWMELPDGRTAYEAMVESGGLAKIASGTLPQLGAGKP